jgi:hypothetical protein
MVLGIQLLALFQSFVAGFEDQVALPANASGPAALSPNEAKRAAMIRCPMLERLAGLNKVFVFISDG